MKLQIKHIAPYFVIKITPIMSDKLFRVTNIEVKG